MNRIHFTVLGNPQAQKRHRTGKWGRYDPSASDKGDFLALCRDNAPERPIEGAVILYVVFWMPIPKGTSQKKIKEMNMCAFDDLSPRDVAMNVNAVAYPHPAHHIKRPDYDNLVKMVKDSLTGVYWKDDSQVQGGGTFKIYSHRPRTEIEIIYMEDNDE